MRWNLTAGNRSIILKNQIVIMKASTRIFLFGRKNRWLAIFLFTAGLSFQIVGEWLPTLVVCYKAHRLPRIEFWQDGCDCRKQCADHSLAGCHEGSVSLHDACLDLPLVTGPGCAPLPDLFNLQGCQFPGARARLTATFSPSMHSRIPASGSSPPRIERTGLASMRILFPGAADPLFSRLRC